MSYTKAKFERTQWPVGHGGFHTGTVQDRTAVLKYFFDCGALAAAGFKLIDSKFQDIAFDFAVISHFDRDHFSQLLKAQVRTVFLPYLTRTDILFCAMFDGAKSRSAVVKNVADFYTNLATLRGRSRVVMVRRGALPPDAPLTDDDLLAPRPGPEENPDEPQVDFSLSRVEMANEGGYRVIPDSAVVKAGHRDKKGSAGNIPKPLTIFKYYNHRSEEFSNEIFAHLETFIASGQLVDSSNNPYISLAEFLTALENDAAAIAHKNGATLKKLYSLMVQILSDDKAITPSNLSSLCMFSQAISSDHWQPTVILGDEEIRSSICRNGWMLTGDLELTRRTWTRFYEHYFLEWEDIKVINVPHHGSSRALHDDVIQQLREGMFLLFPVKKNDKSHPSKMLTDQLDKLRRCTQQNVTEDTDAGFTLSTAWRVENGYQ